MVIRRALRLHNAMQLVVAPGLAAALGLAMLWGDPAAHPLRAGLGAALMAGGVWLPAMFLLSGALEVDQHGVRGRIGLRQVAVAWATVSELRLLRGRRGQAMEVMLGVRDTAGRLRRVMVPNWYEHELEALARVMEHERGDG